MKPDTQSLLEAGWQEIVPLYHKHWCWREPETGALYQLQDALDLLASTKKKKIVKSKERG